MCRTATLSLRFLLFEISNHSSSLFRRRNSIEKSKKVTFNQEQRGLQEFVISLNDESPRFNYLTVTVLRSLYKQERELVHRYLYSKNCSSVPTWMAPVDDNRAQSNYSIGTFRLQRYLVYIYTTLCQTLQRILGIYTAAFVGSNVILCWSVARSWIRDLNDSSTSTAVKTRYKFLHLREATLNWLAYFITWSLFKGFNNALVLLEQL